MGNQIACRKTGVDFDAVRADLVRIMDSPEWDDGSYAPLLIRLAWHSSGTYSRADGTGGSNGATMRYAKEANDPENAGLAKARGYLDSVKQKHKGLSYADLWILAAYVAIQHTGGPEIEFVGGRVDAPEEAAIAPGRLPGAEKGLDDGWKLDGDGRMQGWEKLAEHIRHEVFGRMGFDDLETVALITGGHLYGRCHPEHSGYSGAWVENPTLFSNEYAADMIGDEWIAVQNDTVMPDGGSVPEEVRPTPGKRQYIDYTKYKEAQDSEKDTGAEAALVATGENVEQYPPGRYMCTASWVNSRELPDIESKLVARYAENQELAIFSVKRFGTAVRGRAERGGWVSIVGSGGKELFSRVGDFQLKDLRGKYRAVLSDGTPVFKKTDSQDKSGILASNAEFSVNEVSLRNGSMYGKLSDKGPMQGSWALLVDEITGPSVEKVIQGWNETLRKPLAGQTGHQMMLVSDMVLLWDTGFRKHLEVYAEDEEKLKEDFGKAFKRLTELGCPWSKDKGPDPDYKPAAGQQSSPPAGQCPYLAAKNAASTSL